jgi:hypothetical protein
MGRANAIRPYNNLLIQNEDVLLNPENPENPDSKLRLKAPENQNMSVLILLDPHLSGYTNNR